MPTYLLHQTAAGLPIGVYTDTEDFYDPEYAHLREEGRELVYSKLPNVSWAKFVDITAATRPSATMQWDSYRDSSRNLSVVLNNAQKDTETVGAPEPE